MMAMASNWTSGSTGLDKTLIVAFGGPSRRTCQERKNRSRTPSEGKHFRVRASRSGEVASDSQAYTVCQDTVFNLQKDVSMAICAKLPQPAFSPSAEYFLLSFSQKHFLVPSTNLIRPFVIQTCTHRMFLSRNFWSWWPLIGGRWMYKYTSTRIYMCIYKDVSVWNVYIYIYKFDG